MNNDIWLTSLKRWWDETGNPTYVWEAIARARFAEPARDIPDWCLPYLAKSAAAIAELAIAVARKTITASDAVNQTSGALGLTRQGSNAFANRARDNIASQAALDSDWRTSVEKIAARHGVTEDRAHRIIKRGRRLNGTASPMG